MTAFITLCWKNNERFGSILESISQRVGELRLYWVLLCAGLMSGHAMADSRVELQGLKFERHEAGLYVSANLQFELPSALEEALRKGIALYFVTELDITQERWYVYNQRIAHAERHVRLFYQPLTRRWRVNVSPQAFNAAGLGMSLGQTYDTVEDAMSSIKRINQWQVANAADVNPDMKQMVSFVFKLDLKQLPRPLQIGAVGQSDWDIALTKTQRLELSP